MKQLAILAACGILLGGCATVVRGTTDKVEIKSNPAGVKIVSSTGHQCVTPCTITVPRKEEFTVTFKPQSGEPVIIPVTTKVSGAGAAGMAGNILLGGIIGGGVDVATGASLDHYPNPVFHDFKAPKTPKTKKTEKSRKKLRQDTKRGTPMS